MSKVPKIEEDPMKHGKAKHVGHKALSKKSAKFPQDLQNSDATGSGIQKGAFKSKKLSMA
jgi:hypothetical protein